MKKFLLVLLFIPFISATYAENKNKMSASEVKTQKSLNKVEAKMLISRLYEIRERAQTEELSFNEKIQMRQEVKDIKDRLEKMSGAYVYLSLTTLIIILLLIILL